MACSCTRPNYKGPGVGIWALALSLEFALGVLMVFLGSDAAPDPVSSLENMDQSLKDLLVNGSAAKAVTIIGWFHLVLAAACGVFVTLGLFVCGIFLCPLCILGWVQTAFCVISTFVTAAYLRKYLDVAAAAVTGEAPEEISADVFFAQLNSPSLLLASVLSFVCSVVLSRAAKVSSGESVPGAALMVESMGLYAAIGAFLGAGGGGVSPTPALTTLWVALCVLGAILMNIRACCCEKICNTLMIVLFGVGALLSFITAVVFARIYAAVVADPLGNAEYARLFVVMEAGIGLVVAAVLSLAACVMSLLATAYAARSLICCGDGVSSS
ncbi:hypothetical protein, conserved [Eimeria tenella]|uniref:Transmembrane protein n=1 Tax=Eimeria tenella TaxID=5802 RepID=U6KJ36_EIMTE|nr:hypothetical protein, conserved [Eimeria tenella]CDJ38040.1 hypothetical protein, conserved [Eimeria tenella]|eukprot:XP_013228878.1 hypothetical protein, conserved [Eimeria tenella]